MNLDRYDVRGLRQTRDIDLIKMIIRFIVIFNCYNFLLIF